MLLNLAITLWLLIALPSAVLLWRYGYAFAFDVPLFLIAPKFAPRGLKWCALLFSLLPFNYFLATLFLSFASWREIGWGQGVSSFLIASAVFTWVHNSARKRAIRKLYNSKISDKSHIVQDWDTLTLLADMYHVAAEEITAANGLAPEASLKPGTRLRIPGATPEKALEIVGLIMSVTPFWPPK